MEEKLRTLSVLVENESGVLSQISRLFSRKGFNIESLAVGTTDDPAISRMTIEVRANDNHTTLICAQLAKMVPVHSVKLLVPGHSIRRELVLYKVRARNSEDKNEIIQIANIFRASIIDVSLGCLTVAVIGEESKTGAMQRLMAEFGILELVRTGMVAIERGPHTITDATKEKGEFDYGKNVIRKSLGN
jgi:acetolactate synthase-1/3 small subunit